MSKQAFTPIPSPTLRERGREAEARLCPQNRASTACDVDNPAQCIPPLPFSRCIVPTVVNARQEGK